MNDWARAFSLPAGGDQTALLDAIAGAWATSVVERFLDRNLGRIADSTQELANYLGAWPSTTSTYDQVAHPAFGRADMLLKGRRLDPLDVAARLGLRLAEEGHPGRWAATVPTTSLLLGGYLLDEVQALTVVVDAGARRVEVARADGSTLILGRKAEDDSWTVDASGGAEPPRLPTFSAGRPIALLSGRNLPHDVGSREVFADCLPLDEVDAATQESFQAGSDLIADVVPHYLPWVAGVLRGVVACHRESAFDLTSGSWEDALGYIHMSSPHCAVDVADTLIHEASHQYFYLLERVGPMDDGSDQTLYYSPATRTNRPVSRLLMALHAFVNVLELYEVVRLSDGPEVDYVNANLPKLRRDIDLLDTPLRDSTALTDVGRAIYEPLSARLHAMAGA